MSIWQIKNMAVRNVWTLATLGHVEAFGALRVTLSQFESIQVNLSHFKSLRVTLSHFESLLGTLGHLGAPWGTSSHFRTLWATLRHSGNYGPQLQVMKLTLYWLIRNCFCFVESRIGFWAPPIQFPVILTCLHAVSYTHLTLPTILLV